MSDAATKPTTRLLVMYNLLPQLRVPAGSMCPLTNAFEFGRFREHVEAAGRLLPQSVLREDLDPAMLTFPTMVRPVRALRATATLAVTPRMDAVLVLEVDVGAQCTTAQIAELLFASWRDRAATRVDEVPIAAWLTARVRSGLNRDQPELAFGRNVHQCVFAGGDLADRILRDNAARGTVSAEVTTIVLRGTLTGQADVQLGLQRPETLNNGTLTLVIHGRGVSVIAGWTVAVENSFALAAMGILNAIAVVHRVRRQAFDALELNQAARVSSTSEARALVSRLSRVVSDLQLDLSFSIEAYADSILIPELLVESYHSSLRRISALSEGLANTAQIVGRVGAVMSVRQSMLEAATQEYVERRDKAITVVIAVATLLALPPALLLAFFGTSSSDVDPRRSVADIHHYAVAYALAWLPFVLLLLAGMAVRRKIRVRVPDALDGDRGTTD